MKRRFLILIVIVSFLCCLSPDEAKSQLLLPYRKGNLWGLCDTHGKVKLMPAHIVSAEASCVFAGIKSVSADAGFVKDNCNYVNAKGRVKNAVGSYVNAKPTN